MASAKVPAHPIRKASLPILLMGLGSLVVAVQLAAQGSYGTALVSGMLGAFASWSGYRASRSGTTVNAVNGALARITRGQLDEAEAILDALPPRAREPGARRAIEVQRTMIALARNDAARAVTHATRAIEGRTSLLSAQTEHLQIVAAHSLRALALAARDEGAAALADVAAVRASPIATPDGLARASVAEATVLSRAGDREKLAEVLRRDRKLLLEFTTPRDRALVRALQRTLHSGNSAYRESAKEVERRESELASWIEGVAPATGAVAFAGAPLAPRAQPVTVEASARDVKRARDTVNKRGKGFSPAIGAYVLLIAIFLGAWQFLQPTATGSQTPSAALGSPESALSPVFPIGVLSILAFGLILFLNRWSVRRLTAATRLMILPDLSLAEEAFRKLAKSRLPLVAAQAESHLARLAVRRGDFGEALVLIERALRRVARNVAASDHLVPGLIGSRAYVLAALDRPEDALAELGLLAAAHPAFPGLAGTFLVTRALIAVRKGDLPAAAALYAERTPDLPMGVFDELMADTLAVSREPRPAVAEVDRLRGELSEAPELRTWVQRVWPGAELALDEARGRAA